MDRDHIEPAINGGEHTGPSNLHGGTTTPGHNMYQSM